MLVDRVSEAEREHVARLFLLAQAAQPWIPTTATSRHPLLYVLHRGARETYREKKLVIPDVIYFEGNVNFRAGLDRVRSVLCAEDLTDPHLELIHDGRMDCLALENGILRKYHERQNKQRSYLVCPVNLFTGTSMRSSIH